PDLAHQPDVRIPRLELLLQSLALSTQRGILLLPSSRFSIEYQRKTEVRVACPSGLRRRLGVTLAVQPAAELAAGRVDGPPLGLAHRHDDALVPQDRDEPEDGLGIGPVKWQARHGVVRDQVHMRPPAA